MTKGEKKRLIFMLAMVDDRIHHSVNDSEITFLEQIRLRLRDLLKLNTLGLW